MLYQYVKRFFDIFFSFLFLVLLSPLLLFTSILILFSMGKPILFTQKRVGFSSKIFQIYKFRSMTTDGVDHSLPDAKRVTTLGAILRKTKIDELPQLINILKGDMSFVGPRPELPLFVQYYPKSCAEFLLSVKPGLTDLASINYRNESDLTSHLDKKQYFDFYISTIMPAKLSLARQGVAKSSFFYDLGILLRTFRSLFF